MSFSHEFPRISVNNFMRYLFASLAKEKNVIIKKSDIVGKIFKFKSSSNTDQKYIFNDIEFREGIDNVVSYDIDEGINNLQTLGVIGKLNPRYERIVIYLSEQDAEDILKRCDTEVRDIMRKLAISFR